MVNADGGYDRQSTRFVPHRRGVWDRDTSDVVCGYVSVVLYSTEYVHTRQTHRYRHGEASLLSIVIVNHYFQSFVSPVFFFTVGFLDSPAFFFLSFFAFFAQAERF